MKEVCINPFKELVEAVKKYGVNVKAELTEEEKEAARFETEGIDIDLEDVFSAGGGWLFTVLKNGDIRKALIYIADISSWDPGWNDPRLHILYCKKIKDMFEEGRRHRYRALGGAPEKCRLIKKDPKTGKIKKFEKKLEVCQLCLDKYNKSFGAKWEKRDFPLEEHLKSLPRDLGFSDRSIKYDFCVIPNDYTKDWGKISNRIKERAGWICRRCRRCFKKENCRRFLHAHHIDGNKRNNRPGNLKPLCIQCHSEEPGHAHIKKTPEYKEFLKKCGGKFKKNGG